MAKGASWSMKELQQAIRMKRRGVGYADIAVALGRRMDAVEAKLEFCSKASRDQDARRFRRHRPDESAGAAGS